MRHKIGSKLRIPSAVRLYATHGRLGISLEKRSKCNLAREMQQTHDAAISSVQRPTVAWLGPFRSNGTKWHWL